MDKVRGGVTHVDLHEVRLDQPITASVSVHLIGGDDAPGVKEGGVLSQPLREIQVEALPLEVPEHIDLDVSHMATGDTLRIGDIEVRRASRCSTIRRPSSRRSPRRPARSSPRKPRLRGRRGARAPRARPPRARRPRAKPAEPAADAAGDQGTTEG